MAQIEITTYSKVGGHIQNEDTAYFQEHLSGNLWVCAIADGQGGQRGGGKASQLACQTILELSQGFTAIQLANPRTWIELLRKADEIVCNNAEAGLTTLIAFCIHENYLIGASNGDSALILVNATQDIQITGNQIKNPPIGSGSAAIVPFASPLKANDTVLAMTDGVWKYIGSTITDGVWKSTGWRRLVHAIRTEPRSTLFETLRKMAALPRTGELQDDFTILRATIGE